MVISSLRLKKYNINQIQVKIILTPINIYIVNDWQLPSCFFIIIIIIIIIIIVFITATVFSNIHIRWRGTWLNNLSSAL